MNISGRFLQFSKGLCILFQGIRRKHLREIRVKSIFQDVFRLLDVFVVKVASNRFKLFNYD